MILGLLVLAIAQMMRRTKIRPRANIISTIHMMKP